MKANTAKGTIFEHFVARLMDRFGYERPKRENLNHTSNGIELDVRAPRKVVAGTGIAECKAYTSSVAAKELQAFHGKLVTERFNTIDCVGFFVALPGLTGPGIEQARKIEDHDAAFKYLDAAAVADILLDEGEIGAWTIDDHLTSDPTVFICEHGIYQAVFELDRETRSATSMLVWGTTPVPDVVIKMLSDSSVSRRLPVFDLNKGVHGGAVTSSDVVLVRVAQGHDDFEYQLPSGPEFFVGRQKELRESLDLAMDNQPRSLVVNAHSGWGKSSFAVKLADEVRNRGGIALVLDTRTASDASYLPASLALLAREAEQAGILSLPQDAAFGGIVSSLASLARSKWHVADRPILLFFDQFENVFDDPNLTRAFRDLALAIHEVQQPLKIGFAWKTDLIGWTEDHPYQLREEIRSRSFCTTLSPFVAKDVSTVLNRVSRSIGFRLNTDIQNQLREYCGGYPWLLKKLSVHVIDQLDAGLTEQRLLNDRLTVQTLFENDLRPLSFKETDALKVVAARAPVSSSSLEGSVGPRVLQALIDKRLLVQIGDKLDVYWDIFRDYVNTGTVPIKDGFLLRLRPGPSARLVLRRALETGEPVDVQRSATEMAVSGRALRNVSRELRSLGLVDYSDGSLMLSETVIRAHNPEKVLQETAASALRRHRAYDVLQQAFTQSPDGIRVDLFADLLAGVFAAVEARPATWRAYAMAFAHWLAYAGLISVSGDNLVNEAPTVSGTFLLSGPVQMTGNRPQGKYPRASAKAALEAGSGIAMGRLLDSSPHIGSRAIKTLERLSLVEVTDGTPTLKPGQVVFRNDGQIDRSQLRHIIECTYPGAAEAFSKIEDEPDTPSMEVGLVLRSIQGTEWADATTKTAGEHIRSFARAVGITTSRGRSARTEDSPTTDGAGLDTSD